MSRKVTLIFNKSKLPDNIPSLAHVELDSANFTRLVGGWTAGLIEAREVGTDKVLYVHANNVVLVVADGA